MPTPLHCLRCGRRNRRLIAVVSTASRARFHLCATPCLAATVREMRPRSRKAVTAAIVTQARAAS